MYLDPFEHQLIWNRPIGRHKPYKISIEIDENNFKTILNIELIVTPTYKPKINEISIDISLNNSNYRYINGEIEWINSTSKFVLNFFI